MRSTDPTNARLLAVNAGGVGDSYDGPAAGGPERWAGDVGVWYETKRQRVAAGGSQDVYVWRSLVVSGDLRIEFAEGDVVTFRRLALGAPATETATVAAVEGDESEPGSPGEVVLTFEAA